MNSEFVSHSDFTPVIDGWHSGLGEKVNIGLPETEIEVFSDQPSGLLFVVLVAHNVDMDSRGFHKQGLVGSEGVGKSLDGLHTFAE